MPISEAENSNIALDHIKTLAAVAFAVVVGLNDVRNDVKVGTVVECLHSTAYLYLKDGFEEIVHMFRP
jgi:hypothetical protein